MRIKKAVQDQIEELEKALGTKIELIFNSEFKQVPAKTDDHVRFIYLGHDGSGSTRTYSNFHWTLSYVTQPNRMYNILAKVVGTRSGKIIQNSSHEQLFHVVNNDFYFYYKFENWDYSLFWEYVYEWRNEIKKYIKISKDLDAKSLEVLIRASFRNPAENLERELRDVRGSIIEYQRRLLEHQHRLTEISFQQDFAKTFEETLKKKVGQQELELAKLTSMYESVKITEDNTIVAITKPIVITSSDTAYDMGRYTITIDIVDHGIRFSTDKGVVDGHHQHPHIDTGVACFGEISDEIWKLFGSGEIAIGLQLLHSYLKSYNADDAYIHITNFVPKAWNNASWDVLDSYSEDVLDSYSEGEEEDEEEEDHY